MPYYAAGDYYRGDYYQGDNYAAGGLFGSIGKVLKGAATSLIGASPLGGIVRAIVPGFGAPGGGGGATIPNPGFKGTMQRLLPGGSTGYHSRRRINPLNIKALRRAMRRAKGFEKQARRVGSFFNPGKTFRLKGRARKRS